MLSSRFTCSTVVGTVILDVNHDDDRVYRPRASRFSVWFDPLRSAGCVRLERRSRLSGNSNVWRIYEFSAFALAIGSDMLKGALSTIAAQALYLSSLAVVIVDTATILGHTRSIFFGFSRNKAVATGGSVVLIPAPLAAAPGLAA